MNNAASLDALLQAVPNKQTMDAKIRDFFAIISNADIGCRLSVINDIRLKLSKVQCGKNYWITRLSVEKEGWIFKKKVFLLTFTLFDPAKELELCEVVIDITAFRYPKRSMKLMLSSHEGSTIQIYQSLPVLLNAILQCGSMDQVLDPLIEVGKLKFA